VKLRHRPAPDVTVTDEEPSVKLVFVPPPRTESTGQCFLVRDGRGTVHPTTSTTRREALRELGSLAVRGMAAPLILLSPDGSPTGDRLA
jgi:hypothetical protein